MAYKREQELREVQEEGPPPKTTAGGVRYRDIEDGTGAAIKDEDEVILYYKVLKLGKRSYDGLSGEGTVVFSRGA
jgi:FKBP-type peptidyl-prolyl cis-trans isomerase